ncbi:MAG: hypothetical protein KKH98_04255, partial [Spirochaetes bacterium]|nr:hypothetical protein [Spirochaetota bacterium]
MKRSIILLILIGIIITQGYSQGSKLKYADFELGFFEPSYTWGDSARGAVLTIKMAERGYKSQFSLQADYTFGGWGCGFQIWSDGGKDEKVDCTGAKEIEFWTELPVGTMFFTGFDDEDDEQWRSDSIEQTKAGWQRHVVQISDLMITPYAGNQHGNKNIDLKNVKGLQFTIADSPVKRGSMLLDEVSFTGAKGKVSKPVFGKPYFNKNIKIRDGWFYVNGEKFFVRGIG